MAPPVVAVVLVESTWLRQTGMSALFESKAPSSDVRIIFVTSYNISDNTFAEIVVYPKALEGRWVRVYVPKQEIIAIIVLEKPEEDVSAIGLEVRPIEYDSSTSRYIPPEPPTSWKK